MILSLMLFATLSATEPTLTDAPRTANLEASADRVRPSKILKVGGVAALTAAGISLVVLFFELAAGVAEVNRSLVTLALGGRPESSESRMSSKDFTAVLVGTTAVATAGVAMILVGSLHEKLGFDLDENTRINLGVGAPGTPAGAMISGRF